MSKNFVVKSMTCFLGFILVFLCASNVVIAENKENGYITIKEDRLMDGESEYRFASLNYPQATSDNPWEQENAVKTILAMKGNAARSYTIPVYNGSNASTAYVMGVDSNGKLIFNEEALNKLDNLLALCNQYNVRLIIPLVDHWHWIGGIDGYVKMATGLNYGSDSFHEASWQFYSNDTCMNYFKQMLDHLMNRVNTVSGTVYKEDKAILCWETGNELGAYNQEEYDDDLIKWTNDVVDYLKNDIKVKQLILDGRMSMTPRSASLENKADILGCHYYTGNFALKCTQDTKLAKDINKPFILGEFGTYTKAKLCEDVFEAAYRAGTNGVMMWSLRAHKDGYGYYWHDEDPGNWASYHWPGFPSGDYYDESNILRVIYKYAQLMNGGSGGELIPPPDSKEAPLLYDISSVADIKWRGVVGGAWVEIQRTEDMNPKESSSWIIVAGEEEKINDGGRDGITGFHDLTAITGRHYSYRLRACNESGVGLWSNIVTTQDAQHIVFDTLDLIGASRADINPTEIRNVYSFDHSTNVISSGGILKNSSQDRGYITYAAGLPISQVTIRKRSSSSIPPAIYGSTDGVHYTEIPFNENESIVNAAITDTYYYVRIFLDGNNACQLDDISIHYFYNGNKEELLIPGQNKLNQLIQDRSFSTTNPQYAYKSENLNAGMHEGIMGLEATGAGEIIYKMDNDFSSYRVVAMGKNESAPIVEISGDGVHYTEISPTSMGSEENGWIRILYEDVSLKGSIRFLKIRYTEESGICLVTKVEIASGNKRIPMTSQSPVNILEDGEYYFGDNDNLQGTYVKCINKDGTELLLKKELEGVDLSPYDVLYAWVKGDSSGNQLVFQLIDKNGHIWEIEETLSNQEKLITLPLDNFKQNQKEMSANGKGIMDLSSVTTFIVGVRVTNQKAPDGTIYIDSVSVGNFTKIDDFESYSGISEVLKESYQRNASGGTFELNLDTKYKSEGSYGMRIDYDYKGTGYAGATKQISSLNLKDYDGIRFWYISDGSGNSITYQIKTSDGLTWEATGLMNQTGPMEVYVEFQEFLPPSWDPREGFIDKTLDITEFSIYTNQVGEITSGTIYFDDIRGFNFKDELNAEEIKIEDPGDELTITEFPVVIRGTAGYVKYLTLSLQDKAINIPVQADGTWEYEFTSDLGIYNTDTLVMKAAINKLNGEVIKESVKTVSLHVEGNDWVEPEKPINYIVNGDLTSLNENGMPENWSLEESGASFKMENGFLLCWAQDAYEIIASQEIIDIPAGVYQISALVKAKSNLSDARIIIKQNGEIVSQTPSIDTEDANKSILLDHIEIEEGSAEIIFYALAKTDSNGSTFAFKDVVFQKIANPEKNLSLKENTFDYSVQSYSFLDKKSSGFVKTSQTLELEKQPFIVLSSDNNKIEEASIEIELDELVKFSGNYGIKISYRSRPEIITEPKEPDTPGETKEPEETQTPKEPEETKESNIPQEPSETKEPAESITSGLSKDINVDKTSNNQGNSKKQATPVSTADSSNIFIYIIIIALSLTGLLLLVFRERRIK